MAGEEGRACHLSALLGSASVAVSVVPPVLLKGPGSTVKGGGRDWAREGSGCERRHRCPKIGWAIVVLPFFTERHGPGCVPEPPVRNDRDRPL